MGSCISEMAAGQPDWFGLCLRVIQARQNHNRNHNQERQVAFMTDLTLECMSELSEITLEQCGEAAKFFVFLFILFFELSADFQILLFFDLKWS